jgi:hypothetical protein
MIPFSDKWESMITVLGKEKCIQVLERTIKDFIEMERARFLIRSLRMSFEGFLESPRMLLREAPEVEVIRERDIEVAEYLKNKEALLLKNSYIAHLILHDICMLSGESREQTQKMISNMESEKELAYLEGRNSETNSLFKGNRLKEFLPKYADIEYFFTGMFVENLLWNKKTIEKPKRKVETSDFEVEY